MRALTEYWRNTAFFRFVVIGVWNTVFAYLAFAILYVLLHEHLHYLVIGVTAHTAAVANAYICQRRLVFRSNASWLPAFARFALVQTGTLAWGVLGLLVCVEVLHLHPLLSQLLLMAIAVIATYSLNRKFTFKVLH
jgi:putative flippase GtrA